MSLRLRLLILSLVTLLLPWAGRQYARQMEDVLRAGQEKALMTTAQLVASVVAADADLVDESLQQTPDEARQHLFAAQLPSYPLLDGHPDEWPQPTRSLPTFGTDADKLRLGIFSGALYAFMQVPDSHVRYEIPGDDDRPIKAAGDRVLVLTRDLTGVEQAWAISAVAPGPAIVRRANSTAPWKSTLIEDSEIRGIWRATAQGFDLELRIPLRLVGAELAITHIDDATPPEKIDLLPLRMASEVLRDKLARYAPDGIRIFVVDSQGWLLARAGALSNDADTDSPDLYRWFLRRTEEQPPAYGLPYGMWGPPVDAARAGESSAIWFSAGAGEPSTVRASIPIRINNEVAGVVTVEQAGGQLLRDRDAALANLLGFTFLTTILVVATAFIFAAWLSRRIRRLSVAAAGALSPKGDVDTRMPETTSTDELGDLARSYATLLQRVQEYTQYLRTLGSKLSHEFRTPLAIVSSSLENLAAEKNEHTQTYVQRARDGAARLHGILTSMTEATRIEQSIENTERVDFDLGDLLRGVGQAYANAFATHRIEVVVPPEPCPLNGAPELIVQLLDKLIDNAVDFCPRGQRIAIELAVSPKLYVLSVTNEGPLLAPDAEHKIFDILVSNRTVESAKPHLGLGLFIVQAIARFHGGRAGARNLPNLTGVTIEVELPRSG